MTGVLSPRSTRPPDPTVRQAHTHARRRQRRREPVWKHSSQCLRGGPDSEAASTRSGRGDGGVQGQVGTKAGGLAAAQGEPDWSAHLLAVTPWRTGTATPPVLRAGDLIAWPHLLFLRPALLPSPHFYYRFKQMMRWEFGRLSIKVKVPQPAGRGGAGLCTAPLTHVAAPGTHWSPEGEGKVWGELQRRRRGE